MHIVVKMGTRKSLPLSVEAWHTIASVKWQIGLHRDLPTRELRLIFGDDPALEDDLTMEQARIGEGAVLHCVRQPPLKPFLRMAQRSNKRRRHLRALQRLQEESGQGDEQDEEEQQREEGEQENDADD